MPSLQQDARPIGNAPSVSVMMTLQFALHKERHFLAAVIVPLLLLKLG